MLAVSNLGLFKIYKHYCFARSLDRSKVEIVTYELIHHKHIIEITLVVWMLIELYMAWNIEMTESDRMTGRKMQLFGIKGT